MFSISYKKKIESRFKRYIVFGIISLIYSLINRFHLNGIGLLNIFIRKRYEEGYKFYFLQGNLRKAYILRFKYSQLLSKKRVNLHTNYLDTVYDESFGKYIGSLNHSKSNTMALKNFNYIDIETLLYFGPKTNFSKLHVSDTDHLLINKPVNLSNSGINSSKIILVLNNVFSKHNKVSILNWRENYPEAIVLSPVDLGVNHIYSKHLNDIPKYPYSSGPMALGRSLYIVFSLFSIKKMVINGFDFHLSSKPYHDTYPSLLGKEFDGHVNDGVIKANMKHDLILNFQFTKKIINQYRDHVEGDILDYIDLPVDKVCELFSNKFNK
jgi:hypothetical protein